MKTFRAFLVAPLAPSLIPAFFALVNQTYYPVSVFIFFCGVYYVLQTIVGIPAYIILNRLGRRGLVPYLIVGFLALALLFLGMCIYQWPNRDYKIEAVLYYTVYAGFLGLLPGLFFWLLARPDRANEAHSTLIK